jgi:cellulose synthase/poly-beta-1,6-N-acetylglucosamine synthase-like glycosyltransferase
MHLIATWVFWLCLGLISYVYFGYPALLSAGLLARRREWDKEPIRPRISVIIAAFDEEAVIQQKIDNLLACDYPRRKLEIIIASDGSTDRTDEIASQFRSQGIRLVSSPIRRGKSSIQNDAVRKATGEILIFTDADCVLEPWTLSMLVENFADPTVGLATGAAVFLNTHQSAVAHNEGLYARYEAWIRREESERGLLAAASGSIFAMRAKLWRPLDPNIGDDFVLPIQVALQGYRNIFDPEVKAWTTLPTEGSSMFRVKKRIVNKDLRGLLQNRAILNPFRYGTVAIGLWSHKLLRWLVAYFLCGLLAASLLLLDEPQFRVALALQLAFYSVASIAVIKRASLSLPSVAFSFCLVNLAAMLAVFDYLAKKTVSQWKPVR